MQDVLLHWVIFFLIQNKQAQPKASKNPNVRFPCMDHSKILMAYFLWFPLIMQETTEIKPDKKLYLWLAMNTDCLLKY